jgi:hypothetical protein
LKFSKKPSFLLLDFNPKDKYHSIRLLSDPLNALGDWCGATRISPVWRVSIERSGQDALFFRNASSMFLAGPIDPTIFYQYFGQPNGEAYFEAAYLSLGMSNLIVFVSSARQSTQLANFFDREGHPYEEWVLQPADDSVQRRYLANVKYGIAADRVRDEPIRTLEVARRFELLVQVLDQQNSRHRAPLLEFLATSSAVRARSLLFHPEFATNLDGIEWTVLDLLNEAEESRFREELFALNAALSRHASQALSGTTPISQTECHFWPHSLLGTGIANIALQRLVRFVLSAFDQAGISARIEAVLSLPTSDVFGALKETLSIRDSQCTEFIALDKISEEVIGSDLDSFRQVEVPISYFSARDGFRATDLCISAPLQCVSACNSRDWTLVSISHEISHSVVAHKLRSIADHVIDSISQGTSTEQDLINFLKKEPKTLWDVVGQKLAYVVFLEESAIQGADPVLAQTQAGKLDVRYSLEQALPEFEEYFVHMFDYFHFYDRAPGIYVETVWQSLAVRPTIDGKLRNFVERTLIALACKRIGQSEDWPERARDDMKAAIDQDAIKLGGGTKEQVSLLLAGEANDGSEWSRLRKWLMRVKRLIMIFHLVFKSDQLAKMLKEEKLPAHGTVQGGIRTSYSMEPLVFWPKPGAPAYKFSNPLLFLSQFGRDIEGDEAKSVWMLHLLAFGLHTQPPSSFVSGGDL